MTDISQYMQPQPVAARPHWERDTPKVDFNEIDAQLATNIEGHLNEWFAGRDIKRSGQWWIIGNNGGLKVNAQDGQWADHSEDKSGPGLLSLYAWHHNADIKTAADEFSNNVVQFRPSRAQSVKEKPVSQWEHSIEPPVDIPSSHFDLGEANHAYKYRARDGQAVGVILRWDATESRGKEIRQCSWIQMRSKSSPEWKWCAFAEPRPLYRGERIDAEPDKPILIVEGEKCVEAAEKALPGWIVTSWAGGSSAALKSDWSGFDGRRVVIWPDNDKAGHKVAKQIKGILPHAQIVDTAALGDKEDIADLIDRGVNVAEMIPSEESLFVDLESIFEGDMEPERPTIAMSASGECLLYAGRINEIHGEPSVGKTNINIAIMACELAVGRKVMFVDPEDNPHGIMRRCLSFGLSKELILANLYYLHDPTPEDLITAAAWAERNQPSLVTVDGLAEVITSCGYKEDAANDVLEFFSKYIRPFTRSGAAVMLSDHVTKSTEGRGTWSRGSGAKMGRYDGVSYMVTLAKPYSPTCAGSVKFTIAKDRNGGIGTKGQDVFVAYFEPSDGVTQTSIQRLKKEDTLPMDEIKELVEIVAMHRKEGVSPNQGTITGAKERHKMSAKRAKDVLDLCVENGYIAQAPEKLPGEKSYRFIIGPEVIKG